MGRRIVLAWLSERGTEHVACAWGAPVLGAGEIVLALGAGGAAVAVAEITNQSTGYCPEPESWPAVRGALARAGLEPPPGFSHAFEFRRCEECGGINLLKPDSPECPVCDATLPAAWNFG